jgi:hypothetical protein
MAAAWADQDVELDAEIAALEAVGALTAPAEEEQPGSALDPDSPAPHGLRAWLTDLSGSPIDECSAVPVDATGPKVTRTGPHDHAGGDADLLPPGAAPRFAAGRDADLLSPGAALAGLAEDARAAGLSRLTDDELAGVIRAGRRLSAWASALELAAVSDLMRRREQQEAAGQLHAAEHADAEIAALLTLTGRGAGRVLDLAIALRRLPLTARALEAGVIDLPRVAVIADETIGLDDDHVAAVEQHILIRAPGQTTSQVRAAVRRAVLTADPRAARKRREQAQREARVERWGEHAGTAALAGRDLPPAAVIAADQHISALARGLRVAGLAGNADQLRAQVFLALLSGIPASALLPASQQRPDPAVSGSGTSADPPTPGQPAKPGTPDMPGRPGVPGQPGVSGSPGTADSPVIRGGPGGAARSPSAAAERPGSPASAGLPGTSASADWPGSPANTSWPGNPENAGRTGTPASANSPGNPANTTWPGSPASTGWPGSPASTGWPGIPPVAGTVNLTMPLSTWLGLLDAPGEVTGFGPLTADDSRHLATAIAGHCQAHWCVTLTGEDGRPVGHGCTRPRCGPPGSSPGACAPPPQGPAPPNSGPAPPEHGPAPREQGPAPPDHGPAPPEQRRAPPEHGPAPPEREARVAAWLASIPMKWFESDGCAHRRQSAAYRPPPALQHLIRVRQQTCAFPGCRRPASQCDLDHTTPFQRGGPTCECNLAPLCRKHHRCKQGEGWRLEQPNPGMLVWQTPSGRTYSISPTEYPV